MKQKKTIRLADSADYSFLRQMLYAAIFIPEGEAKPPLSFLDSPDLDKYLNGWMKATDCGFIGEIEGEAIGAAWTRLFENAAAGGYGFIDNKTPELCLAVSEHCHGIGIGSALMKALLSELKCRGYKKISLSVDKANRAVTLYKKLGFKVVKEQNTDFLMIKDL